LIFDIVGKKHFCHHCSNTICPTFATSPILTREDVKFLRRMGIQTGTENIERFLGFKSDPETT
jgi:hypothetical protein